MIKIERTDYQKQNIFCKHWGYIYIIVLVFKSMVPDIYIYIYIYNNLHLYTIKYENTMIHFNVSNLPFEVTYF